MKLMGEANWWMPAWAARALRVERKQELPEAVFDSA